MAELHSIVVPVFNEQEVLPQFHRRVTSAMSGVPGYEVVFVDDGSADETPAMLDALAAGDPRVRVVHLGRNFGQQAALIAGIDHAVGDTVTVIDVDLQDPPELVPEMIELWRGGADVVYAVRESRAGERVSKRASASLYYRALRMMTAVDIPVDASEFRLVSRRVADELRGMREHSRYLRGLVSWVGMRRACITYHRDPRAAGETKFPFFTMLRLGIDGVVSFSTRPLQFAMWMGFAAAFVGFAYGLYVMAYWALTHRPVAGWTSLMVALLFFSGVQLITVGIIGEYIGRIYDEVRGRPLYTVADRAGFASDDGAREGRA